MVEAEYRAYLLQCYRIMFLIAGLPLDEMVEAINHAEAVGPIVDPTLYRTNAKAMYEDKTIVVALRKAAASLPAEMLQSLRERHG